MIKVMLRDRQAPVLMLDRRARTCAHAYAGDGRFRYACTLDRAHGGVDHEDRLTEAPTIYAWRKPELIMSELPRMRVAPRMIHSPFGDGSCRLGRLAV